MGPILFACLAFSLPAASAPGRLPFPRPAIPSGDAPPQPLNGRYALWDGQTAPLPLPQDQAYRFSPDAAPDRLSSVGDASGPASAGSLFVSVELGPRNDQEELKDAVAALGQTAGFRADARFPPVEAAHGEGMKVFGWLPGPRLGQAVRQPGVRGVEIEHGVNRPASGASAQIEVLVGVRRQAGLTETEDDARFSRTMRELADDARFDWERTVGYQAVPGSSDVAILVVGKAPARMLGRLLANPGVIKVQEFPGLAPEPPAAPGKLDALRRFLAYVAAQSPLLLAVTGLLLLPPFRPRLKRLTGR